MSVVRVRDEFLARRAARGDGAAFVILAWRCEPIIAATVARACPGAADEEVLRQAALLGLWQACRVSDGLSGSRGSSSRAWSDTLTWGPTSSHPEVAARGGVVELSTAVLERRQDRWRAA